MSAESFFGSFALERETREPPPNVHGYSRSLNFVFLGLLCLFFVKSVYWAAKLVRFAGISAQTHLGRVRARARDD